MPFAEIWINPQSRDAIAAVLPGLQHIWSDEQLRARVFALLDQRSLTEVDRSGGRLGLGLRQILGMGVLQQGVGCACDRPQELAHHHDTVRTFLRSGAGGDRTQDEHRTVVDNVSLRTPELLAAGGCLVRETGRPGVRGWQQRCHLTRPV